MIFGTAVAIEMALLGKMTLVATSPAHSIEFVTTAATYKIPDEVIVPGSMMNGPRPGDLTTDGPSVDLFFDVASLGISESASDSADEDGILVTLHDVSQSQKASLRNNDRKTAAMTLTGQFRKARVELDPLLGLYRVYPNVERDNTLEWELVRKKPQAGAALEQEYNKDWVASCHFDDISNTHKCVFETEILGMYTYISTSESNYQKFGSIKIGLIELLGRWKI